MIRVSGDRCAVSGAMTIVTAASLLLDGKAALSGNPCIFDLSEVTDVDSSAIAVIFAWMRAAQAQNQSIQIAHSPKELLSLAAVYGVEDLLPV